MKLNLITTVIRPRAARHEPCRRRRGRPRAVIVAATLTLSACGSDDTTTATNDITPTSTASDATSVPTGASATSEETIRFWIEPNLVDCEGAGPQKCMEVAETENGDLELFYDGIEGFTFVEGNAYVIDVTVQEDPNPPADASSLIYTLAEVIDQIPN